MDRIDRLKRYGQKKSEEEGQGAQTESENLPTRSGREISYPEELRTSGVDGRTRQARGPPDVPPVDPYEHLGPIGYTANTYKHPTSGKSNPLVEIENTHLGFSYKASVAKELARRMILAETPPGLPDDIDDDSLAETAEGYYQDRKGPDRSRNYEIHKRKSQDLWRNFGITFNK